MKKILKLSIPLMLMVLICKGQKTDTATQCDTCYTTIHLALVDKIDTIYGTILFLDAGGELQSLAGYKVQPHNRWFQGDYYIQSTQYSREGDVTYLIYVQGSNNGLSDIKINNDKFFQFIPPSQFQDIFIRKIKLQP